MALSGPKYYGDKYFEGVARASNFGQYGYLIDDTDNSISQISGNQERNKLLPGQEGYQDAVRLYGGDAARGSFQEYIDTYFPGGSLRTDLQTPVAPLTQQQNDMENAAYDEFQETQKRRDTGTPVKTMTDAEVRNLTPGGTKQRALEAAGLDKDSKAALKASNLPSARLKEQEAVQTGSTSQSSIDVITDPVTGQSYSRDLSIPGSTYKRFNGQLPTAPASDVAPPNQAPSTDPGSSQSYTLEDYLGRYGVSLSPNAGQQFKLAPAASFKEVYQNLYDELGLGKVRKQIDSITKEMGKLDQELADKIADVNDDPWLTEGVRVSKIRKLEERYDLKRAPFASNLTTLENLWNDGREEARYVSTQALNQYNTEREFALEQINDMQEQAERERDAAFKLMEFAAEQSAPGSISDQFGTGIIGEYNFAVSQGYDGSFIEYQNEDANRKRKATGVDSSIPSTESERAAATLSEYESAIYSGGVLPNGDHILYNNDSNITSEAWRALINDFPGKRETFISEFGYLVPVVKGKIPDTYGLTAVEKQKILGN